MAGVAVVRRHPARVVIVMVTFLVGAGIVGVPPSAGATPQWNVGSSSSAEVGDRGALYRFNVKTEVGLGYDADRFAGEALTVLSDPRSWIGVLDVRFQLVAGGSPSGSGPDPDVEFTLYLASPATVDRLCAPLRTVGKLSCRNGNRVVENIDRWMGGPDVYHDGFADDLDTYRTYLINHEVGHRIGRGHENISGCRSDMYAPVMMQQTFGLRGCAANGWPAWDRLTEGTQPMPVEPAPDPAPSGPCSIEDVHPWGPDDRPLDDSVRRLYEAAFARSPDPDGLTHWLAERARGVRAEEVARRFLASPEGLDVFGDDHDADFVARLYENVLRREPDAAGAEFWLGRLEQGMARPQLLLALADSPENVVRTSTTAPQPAVSGWLARLYRVAFDRPPDCDGARHWEWAEARSGRSAVVVAVLQAPEFAARYGPLDHPTFVAELYRNVLGRDPEPSGASFWTDALATGRRTRTDLVEEWLASPEMIVRTGTTP